MKTISISVTDAQIAAAEFLAAREGEAVALENKRLTLDHERALLNHPPTPPPAPTLGTAPTADAILTRTCTMALEGIVAKHRDDHAARLRDKLAAATPAALAQIAKILD
jgi:hypothetical protein